MTDPKIQTSSSVASLNRMRRLHDNLQQLLNMANDLQAETIGIYEPIYNRLGSVFNQIYTCYRMLGDAIAVVSPSPPVPELNDVKVWQDATLLHAPDARLVRVMLGSGILVYRVVLHGAPLGEHAKFEKPISAWKYAYHVITATKQAASGKGA